MKSLIEVISDTEKISILDEQIIKHIKIHEAFNNTHVYYTFEGIGLFKGCKEIIKYFDTHFDDIFVDGNINMTIKGSDICKGLFFDELKLIFKYDADDFFAEYVIGYSKDDDNDKYEDSKWDIDNQRFKFIEINIYNIDDVGKSEIFELLTHELTHAYNDYMLHTNAGTSLRNIKVTDKFKSELKDVSRSLKFNQVLDIKNKDKYSKYLTVDIPYIENILYYLEKTEINSYIAQLNQVLKGKHFSTGKEVVDYLNNNSASYYNYKYLYNLFNDDSYVNSLIELGFKKSTVYKFRKITKHTWNKIINHIYHILDDNVSIKEDVFARIDKLAIKLWDR